MPAGSRPTRRPRGRALAAVVLVVSPAGEAAEKLVLPGGSVGKAQLTRGAMTRPKLAAGAVDGIKVADGSLGLADLGAADIGAACG
ncbi:MAG: hypothetical protein R3C15_07110 [Thermoleophilia bacterium]